VLAFCHKKERKEGRKKSRRRSRRRRKKKKKKKRGSDVFVGPELIFKASTFCCKNK
jgi:hypothetical protein